MQERRSSDTFEPILSLGQPPADGNILLWVVQFNHKDRTGSLHESRSSRQNPRLRPLRVDFDQREPFGRDLFTNRVQRLGRNGQRCRCPFYVADVDLATSWPVLAVAPGWNIPFPTASPSAT